MPSKPETRSGQCPTHGTVEATRDIPQPSWPYLVYAVRRLRAKRQPFRCPTCGEPVPTA